MDYLVLAQDDLRTAILDMNQDGIRSAIQIHKADPNHLGADGKTPLLLAVERRDLDSVQTLLGEGANLEVLKFEKPSEHDRIIYGERCNDTWDQITWTIYGFLRKKVDSLICDPSLPDWELKLLFAQLNDTDFVQAYPAETLFHAACLPDPHLLQLLLDHFPWMEMSYIRAVLRDTLWHAASRRCIQETTLLVADCFREKLEHVIDEAAFLARRFYHDRHTANFLERHIYGNCCLKGFRRARCLGTRTADVQLGCRDGKHVLHLNEHQVLTKRLPPYRAPSPVRRRRRRLSAL